MSEVTKLKLVGADTYVVGDYHFTNGKALPVKAEYVEYLKSLKSIDDKDMFAEGEDDEVLEPAGEGGGTGGANESGEVNGEIDTALKPKSGKVVIGKKGQSSDAVVV